MSSSARDRMTPCLACDEPFPLAAEECPACGRGRIVLDKFRVEQRLGRGGMASVYAAKRLGDGESVAVKVMRVRGQEGWKGRELFERSSKVLRQLEHPQLPKVYDFGELDDGSLVLVRERVDGGTLASLVADEGWRGSAKQVRGLLRSLLEVLAFLHERVPPVVHRDIKPSNVMFRQSRGLGERENPPLLVDFDTVAAPGRSTDGGETVVVSPGYTAPEQLAGGSSAASDLFSLGMTMVFVATHRDPESFARDADGRIELEGALDGLDPECRRVIEMLVEPRRGDRPDSAAWALTQLEESASAHKRSVVTPATVAKGSVATEDRPPSRSPLRVLAVLVVPAAVIAGTTTAYISLGSDDGAQPRAPAAAPASTAPPPRKRAEPAAPPPPVVCDATLTADCDGIRDNGCETDLAIDKGNCGACENVCPADQRCAAGKCHPPPVLAVSAEGYDRCELRGDGSLWCSSSVGSDPTRVDLPRAVVDFETRGHVCAVTADGVLHCWGDNGVGQAGTGSGRRKEPKPVAIESLQDVSTVSLGRKTGCAVAGGQAYCWGSALSFGVIGGADTHSDTPIEVPGMDQVTALDSGPMHVCVARAGSVWCWGDGRGGATGDESRPQGSDPTEVPGLGDVTGLALGRDHSCALSAAGRVACWGTNADGQLGNGTTDDSFAPVEVAVDGVVEIAAGQARTCARTGVGTVWCWGEGVASDRRPVRIEGLSDVAAISMDRDDLLAIDGEGVVVEVDLQIDSRR